MFETTNQHITEPVIVQLGPRVRLTVPAVIGFRPSQCEQPPEGPRFRPGVGLCHSMKRYHFIVIYHDIGSHTHTHIYIYVYICMCV